jgi:hypothetical protein
MGLVALRRLVVQGVGLAEPLSSDQGVGIAHRSALALTGKGMDQLLRRAGPRNGWPPEAGIASASLPKFRQNLWAQAAVVLPKTIQPPVCLAKRCS